MNLAKVYSTVFVATIHKQGSFSVPTMFLSGKETLLIMLLSRKQWNKRDIKTMKHSGMHQTELYFKDRSRALSKDTSFNKHEFFLMDHVPEVSSVALDTVFHTKFNIHLVKCPMYIDHLDLLGFVTCFLFFWSSTMLAIITTLFVVPICLKTSSIAPSSSFWENIFLPRMPWCEKTENIFIIHTISLNARRFL